MTAASVRLTAPFAQLFRWWWGELRACLPSSEASARRVRSHVLMIRMLQDEVVFYDLKGSTGTEIGRLLLDGAEAPSNRGKLATMKRKTARWRAKVVLCLPSDSVLQCQVSLPLAAQENLREVVGFEMERFTAFKADEVYYSCRLMQVDRAEKRVAVRLVAVPRSIADKAIELAADWGLPAQIVTIADDDLRFDRTVNLLPKTSEAKSQRLAGRLFATLSVIAIGLAALAIGLDFHQQQRLLAAYEARSAESRTASQHADELRTQLSRLLEHSRYVAQQKQSRPLLVEILDETTRLLPDNTWVTQFRLQKQQITLSGYSAAASSLIERLEASPMLAQVRFASPVTLDAKLGVERFNLSAQLAGNGGAP
ncbi:MAG: PilN domain-containing protein [Hypericibacter sp.]